MFPHSVSSWTSSRAKELVTAFDCQCKIGAVRGETEMHRVQRIRIKLHSAAILFALVSLLATGFLWALPLNSPEHECCRHMLLAQDCTEVNSSACCDSVMPNLSA